METFMNDINVYQILFIDPDTDWLDFAVRTLKRRGLSVQGATDIGKVGRASRFVPELQLIFVDLEFAERAPDRLRHFAENRYVVVLFPTGLTPHRMSRVFKLGVYDCVGKPFDAQSLVRLTESLIREICPAAQDAASFLASNRVLAT